MLVVFGLTTGEFVVAGILPDVAEGLGVSVPSAGLLVTAYAVGMIVGGPVVTVLTARVPRRSLVVGLVSVAVVANGWSAAAPGYASLLVGRFAAGLVVATFFAVAITTAVGTAPEGGQASAVAKLTVGMNLGMVLGTPLGTLVSHALGWRASFGAVALLVLVALPLVGRSVPADGAALEGVSAVDGLRAFAHRGVLAAIALTVLGNVGVVMVFSFVAPLMTDVAGFSSGAVPVLLLVYGAGAVLGNFAGGRLADRALMPSVAGLLAALAGVLAVGWFAGTQRVTAGVLVFVLGALAFAVVPGMQTRVVTAARTAPTLAVAVNASGFQVAAAFAGWLGGRLIESGGGARGLYPVAAGLTAAGVVVAVVLLLGDRRGAGSAPVAEDEVMEQV
ncbi:MFS transporter [Actinomadura logoneensis]|uniref:MFS transporter n=2 Tax=Actinomadura logoneensis TaxID=2293572 RepID=A0A372J9X5_9ACTN|nr:MFS transporter [Actinomadura logoneensis]